MVEVVVSVMEMVLEVLLVLSWWRGWCWWRC